MKVLRSNGSFKIIENFDLEEIQRNKIDKFQLILRPINNFIQDKIWMRLTDKDLTKNDCLLLVEDSNIWLSSNVHLVNFTTFEHFRKQLLQNHYDIFCLIEQGLAIDKNQIKDLIN